MEKLKHKTKGPLNIRRYADIVYKQDEIVFYKRANKIAGKGLATVIGTDGKQILLKHGSFHVTVHSCHNRQLEDSFSNISAQPVHLHPESETVPFKVFRKLS